MAQVPKVIDAYMAGLRIVFAIAAATFAVSALVAMCSSWGKLEPREKEMSIGGE